MKASQFFISTLKEAPADAEIVSHKLMMRAGMIRKLGAGIYNYLPMGLRVIRKVENKIGRVIAKPFDHRLFRQKIKLRAFGKGELAIHVTQLPAESLSDLPRATGDEKDRKSTRLNSSH